MRDDRLNGLAWQYLRHMTRMLTGCIHVNAVDSAAQSMPILWPEGADPVLLTNALRQLVTLETNARYDIIIANKARFVTDTLATMSQSETEPEIEIGESDLVIRIDVERHHPGWARLNQQTGLEIIQQPVSRK